MDKDIPFRTAQNGEGSGRIKTAEIYKQMTKVHYMPLSYLGLDNFDHSVN